MSCLLISSYCFGKIKYLVQALLNDLLCLKVVTWQREVCIVHTKQTVLILECLRYYYYFKKFDSIYFLNVSKQYIVEKCEYNYKKYSEISKKALTSVFKGELYIMKNIFYFIYIEI